MTYDEMYSKILEILPHAEMGEDNDGQLIIYTGLKETEDGYVEEMVDYAEQTEGDGDDCPRCHSRNTALLSKEEDYHECHDCGNTYVHKKEES